MFVAAVFFTVRINAPRIRAMRTPTMRRALVVGVLLLIALVVGASQSPFDDDVGALPPLSADDLFGSLPFERKLGLYAAAAAVEDEATADEPTNVELENIRMLSAIVDVVSGGGFLLMRSKLSAAFSRIFTFVQPFASMKSAKSVRLECAPFYRATRVSFFSWL